MTPGRGDQSKRSTGQMLLKVAVARAEYQDGSAVGLTVDPQVELGPTTLRLTGRVLWPHRIANKTLTRVPSAVSSGLARNWFELKNGPVSPALSPSWRAQFA